MRKKTGLIILAVLVSIVSAVGIGYYAVKSNGEKKMQKSILSSADEKDIKKRITYNRETYRYREDLINILCLGIGKNKAMGEQVSKSNTYGQSDAVYLLSIDVEKETVRVITVPRESMVPVEKYYTSGKYQQTDIGQLCTQYAYGDGKEKSVQLTKKAVKSIFDGIPVQKVCAVNFRAIPVINDAVGGVTVKIQEDMSAYAPQFKKGETVRLKGKQAVTFLQERDCNIFKSSLSRVERQKQYMKAFVKQAKKALKKDPSIPLTVYKSLSENMYTDIQLDEATYLVSSVLGYTFSEKEMYCVPGEMKMGERYEEYYIDREEMMKMMTELFYENIS